MKSQTIKRLEYLCNIIPSLLNGIDDNSFSTKPSPEKWSKKEILGHLIDSATNNHQRFIRGQFEDSPTIWYEQNKWNEHSHYQQMDKQMIIELWTIYNKYLATIIKFIPEENLLRTCTMKDGSKLTLEFLIDDYVQHLEHHLKQVVEY